MKAISFDHPGEPADVLAVSEQSPAGDGTAHLPQGHVRVKMLAAPINPSDLGFIRGIYGIAPKCPQSPGFEGVGLVTAANAGLLGRVLTGRRVTVLHPTGGTWAGETVVPAKRVIPVGDSLSLEEAATFFVNPATAWVLCKEVLSVPAGATLLQTAGNSNLGRMVIRLGKLEHFRTLSIVRREDQVDALNALGADHVIAFDVARDSLEKLQSEVAECGLTGKIRHAIDPVGGSLVPAILGVLAHDARLVLYGSLSLDPAPIQPRHLLTTGQSIEGFWLSRWMERQSLFQKMKLIRRLKRLIREGVFKTDRFQVFSADQIREAVLAAEQPGSGEKVLIRFNESD